MSLCVGLGASQADLDVQGEIDFDFFEESENSNKTSAGLPSDALSSKYSEKSTEKTKDSSDCLPEAERDLSELDPNLVNVPESCSSVNFNKPVITVSCDDATGIVQKTTIETVIPTPFNYKESKCGKMSPHAPRKGTRILSPRLQNKLFKDTNDISDDSSISGMSDSESDISESDGSFELEGTDSMTDVTPLMSPFQCNSPCPDRDILSPSTSTHAILNLPKKEAVKFAEVPRKDSEKSFDVQELINAVKRLDMSKNINAMCQETSSMSSFVTRNARCRKNLSFSNEEVRRIDNDNQNLLKKIIAQQTRSKARPSSVHVVSSSAVNRQRYQRQIELENLALLKRLESTKPSRDVSRGHLLRDYESRSSGVLSRASSRSSKSCGSSSHGSCRTSAQSSAVQSGRSSAISMKSSHTTYRNSLSSLKTPQL